MKKVIGFILLLSPLVGITAAMVNDIGIANAALIWAATIGLLAIIVTGTILIGD